MNNTMKAWQYTNGVGHLIMSIFLTLIGLVLVLIPGVSSGAQGVGIGLILTVQGAWFVSGAAKQVATEVVKQAGQAVQIVPVPNTSISATLSSGPVQGNEA